MIQVFDIALKDIRQMLRDRNTFLFLLIMPVLFTFLFGYAFGGIGGSGGDPRLPVAFVDHDESSLSRELSALLDTSDVVRLQEYPPYLQAEAEERVADEELAGAVIVPDDYAHTLLRGSPGQLELVAGGGTGATTVESAVLSAANRLDGAVRAALLLEEMAGDTLPFDYGLAMALAAWEDPPFQVVETTSSAITAVNDSQASMAHTAPGVMLQFGIAGLLTAAQVIVTERKSRALQRLMTTSVRRFHILLGHYLAIFIILGVQFALLIAFGQFLLGVNYLRDPAAVSLVAAAAALCISALGLLIGVLARSEEQAIIFSLIPMFVFAGLGGAWVPLEVTGEAFQAVGHLSPVAWAMDGFKNISIRGLGLSSVVVPVAALLGYALFFFAAAAWRFQRLQEK